MPSERPAENAALPVLYHAIGGPIKCRQLAEALYARLVADPILGRFFPGKSQRCAIEAFASFLAQFLGGPSPEAQHRWWLSLRESHLRFAIGRQERDAWMAQMAKALEDVRLPEEMRSALQQFFEDASNYLVNIGEPAVAAERSIEGLELSSQLAHRWREQVAVDAAVEAVREGNASAVAALMESAPLQSCFRRNRSVFAQFVGTLIGSGHASMAEVAARTLQANPDLAKESYSGRNLLHAAGAAGNSDIITALLKLGVDADVQDAGGHTPLYCLANEYEGDGTAVKSAVAALVHGGANVNACDGVKRCTPLHMAARRGNRGTAQALLDCGAYIEARDSLGETPLRRAVNCRKVEVASLLLSKGADPHSISKKGLTPLTAARDSTMRTLLERRSHT